MATVHVHVDEQGEIRTRRIGFTGSKKGLSRMQFQALSRLLDELNPGEIHHGDCLGADADFHELCQNLTTSPAIHVHPPLIDKWRAYCHGNVLHPLRSYLERNHDIVDASELLIAAPNSYREKRRSGTWATVRYARKLGVPVRIIDPSGQEL